MCDGWLLVIFPDDISWSWLLIHPSEPPDPHVLFPFDTHVFTAQQDMFHDDADNATPVHSKWVGVFVLYCMLGAP